MKNRKIQKLLFPLFFLTIYLTGNAYDFCVDGIYYTITNERRLRVEVAPGDTICNYYSGDVVVPRTVDYDDLRYTVTGIGERAFMRCTDLTSVELPSTLTSIGRGAFHGCRQLSELKIPESVTEIAESAFSSCSNLNTINLPEGLTVINDWLFDRCSSLESVTLPEGIQSIGNQSFNHCYALKSIEIPEQVQSIGWSAFYECISLERIQIPDLITIIELSTFAGCRSLRNVTLGSKIKEIQAHAFSRCTSLDWLVSYTIVPPECGVDMGLGVFNGVDLNNVTLFVPEGSKEAYSTASQWQSFGNINELIPKPTITIENVVKNRIDDDTFKLTCTVKCERADYLSVDVEEQFNSTVRNYRFDNPSAVEVETGNITSVYDSRVTFHAVSEAGTTTKVLKFESDEIAPADGLYYSGTDGNVYHLDNEGNTTILAEKLPHTFQLLQVKDRIYGTSAGENFGYSSTAVGDGKLFYLSKHKNGDTKITTVLDNRDGLHNRDPYGLAAYNDDIYVFDKNESIKKISYEDRTIPQDYPSWLENSWIDFYGNGWHYGCIKGDLQITEGTDKDGNPEPVFWLSVNYNGNALFRFKSEAVSEKGYRNSSYNQIFLSGLYPKAIYLDEANDHLYISSVDLRGYFSGLYQMKLSELSRYSNSYQPGGLLIDESEIRDESSEASIIAIPQLSVDNNGEYLYWCYRAPNPEESAIKRIKLGEAKPTVEIVAKGVDGYGVVAINYKGTEGGITDIVTDDSTDAPVEYFNLQGMRVAEPQPGSIVIRRQGSKVRKIRL